MKAVKFRGQLVGEVTLPIYSCKRYNVHGKCNSYTSICKRTIRTACPVQFYISTPSKVYKRSQKKLNRLYLLVVRYISYTIIANKLLFICFMDRTSDFLIFTAISKFL